MASSGMPRHSGLLAQEAAREPQLGSFTHAGQSSARVPRAGFHWGEARFPDSTAEDRVEGAGLGAADPSGNAGRG